MCDDQQTWAHLPARSFLTPYTELRAILARLAPAANSTFIDLGAGYGRLGFVLARHYPSVKFIGYECVQQRVVEGVRCLLRQGCSNAQLLLADISREDFTPDPAEYYFIYDFGTKAAIEKILGNLRERAKTQTITVIGRGRASRDAIEKNHPWLSTVTKPDHTPHFSIYRSAE